MPEPTGPLLGNPDEVLRRNVSTAMMTSTGPMAGAFIPAAHDGMMSAVRERVTPDAVAASWQGTSPLAGTWPVEVRTAVKAELPCYDDGELPHADGCGLTYDQDHASVDFRELPTRGAQERKAKVLRAAALDAGPLYVVP